MTTTAPRRDSGQGQRQLAPGHNNGRHGVSLGSPDPNNHAVTGRPLPPPGPVAWSSRPPAMVRPASARPASVARSRASVPRRWVFHIFGDIAREGTRP